MGLRRLRRPRTLSRGVGAPRRTGIAGGVPLPSPHVARDCSSLWFESRPVGRPGVRPWSAPAARPCGLTCGGRPRRSAGDTGADHAVQGGAMATITVREYERAVRLVDGRVRDVLGPGRHRYRRRRTELYVVDVRPQLLTVAGQEMLTSDGITVRLTAVVCTAVTDPRLHLTASQDAQAELYVAVQQALRTAVAGLTLDALLNTRTTLGAELLDEVRAVAQRVGRSVAEVAVRDVMLPGDLRRAYAETALARERG